MATENKDTGEGCFVNDDWDLDYRGLDKFPPDGRKLLDLDLPQLGAPTGKVADECEALLKLRVLRTSDLVKRIHRQAQGEKHAIQPVLDVLGINYDRPPKVEASALRQVIQTNIRCVTFIFKDKYLRGRPSKMCSTELEPMFERPDRCHPGHPAYPSGHATMAYTWAYFFAKFVPQRKKALLEAAAEVALNREIAGVHYASDSEAGRILGEQIARFIISDTSGTKLTPAEHKVLLQGWI